MKKILYTRKFWFTVIILFTAIFSIVLFNIKDVLLKNWFDTLNITIGVIGLFSTLYNYWNKFNLAITRLRIILTNSSSIWNVSANIEGKFNEDDFKKLIYMIKTENNRVSDYYEISSTLCRMNISGLSYSFEYTDMYDSENDVTVGKIYCRVIDFTSSYDHSIKILENNIIPYFGIIEKELRPDKTDYTFKISFEGGNPFIRLITKNIDTKTINSLWYSTREKTTTGNRVVKVSENSIECTTSNITDFQSSSVNYISLVGD